MDNTQINELLQKGIRAARQGKNEPARQILLQVLKEDANNEQAWMWMTRVVQEPELKIECLQEIIKINPSNQWAVDELNNLMMGTSSESGASEDAFEEEAAEAGLPPLEPVSGSYEFEILKCPTCQGNFDIKGGEQIKAIVCEYCGSVVDLTPGQAAVIGNAGKKARAMVPIEPGMEANIDNMPYQVVGWLRYEGWDDEDRWRWDEWLLASGEGEYRWLSYDPEAGFILQKKLPFTEPIDINRGANIPVPGGVARVKERAQAKIIGMAGELTWRAKLNDRIKYLEAEKDGTHYTVEANTEELELLAGKPIPEEAIWTGFGNQEMVDALKTVGSEKKSYKKLAIACFVFFLLSCGCTFCAVGSGSSILNEPMTVVRSKETRSNPFDVKNANRLHQITLTASSPTNEWDAIHVDLLDSQNKKTRLLSKTFGVGDTSVSHVFRPDANGTYRIVATFGGEKVPSGKVSIRVTEGVWSSTWLTIFSVVCIILGGYFFVMSMGGSKPPFSHNLARTLPKKE